MNNTIKVSNAVIIFGIPLLIIAVSVLVVYSSVFNKYPNELSLAVTLDLLLTLPIVYFLLIRKTKIQKTTVVPILVLGVIVSSLIIPEDNQQLLNLFKSWALPVIEGAVILFIIFKVNKAIKHFSKHKEGHKDFYNTLRETCYEILPKIAANMVATEIAVFYYGFINWKKRTLNKNEFSYHKQTGTLSLLGAVIFLIIIETVALHLLLTKWSPLLVWILSILSIYTGIQILGFLKSIPRRPITIEQNKLYLRYGIMSEATVAISNIESINQSSKEIEKDVLNRKLSILGDLESHSVIITLKNESVFSSLYGIKKPFKVLAFHVDEKQKFVSKIENLLN